MATDTDMNSPRSDSVAAKRILVYRNGDSFFQAHKVVVNKRACKTYEALLRDVTSSCKLPKFCRCLYTPRNGHRVKGLDELESDKAYVAAGGEKFKRIGYTEIQDPLHKRPTRRLVRDIEPVKHSNIHASARFKKVMQLSPLTIFVYLNGEFLRPASRILLTPRLLNMHSIDAIYETVQDRVITGKGAIAKLVTLDGTPVRNAADLKNLEYYVALGKYESFVNCGYGRPREPLKLSPRLDRRDQGLYMKQGRNTYNFKAKRFRKGASSKKEDSDPFYSKPVTHKRSGEAKTREVNYDNEDDIFRASSREKERAAEVEETRDTKVDLPVDQVEAEEVKEDEGTGNDNNDQQPSEGQVTDTPPGDEASNKKPSDEEPDQSSNNNAETSSAHSASRKSSTHEASGSAHSVHRADSSADKAGSAEASGVEEEKGDEKKDDEEGGNEDDDEDQKRENAATQIQKNVRGYQQRKKYQGTKQQRNDAQTKIAANYRGYKTRKDLAAQKEAEAAN